ncbi:adenylyltransferase and sulfurtransferase MOCS3 [Anthonomus grandis grandis]|uniref:adenylyltransferase and sulfurtransferase MOCS3 n=1 Tax=Anthonomus grandis grandis TaxID=2921223 RepID=UPI002166B6F9|nr:adenylyltransferase and sulfurtransferase MOCS3 [Anthonomus grandis grandis]
MCEIEIKSLIEEIRCLSNVLREKKKLLSEYLAKKKSVEVCKYSRHLSTEEITRYSRQMLVNGVGLPGQIKLKNSKVLIVGAGGLGCPVSVYLAGAGIGEITVVDYDEVELSNLHRQILHTEDDIGIAKVDSVFDKLHSFNSNIKIIPLKKHLDSNTLSQLLKENTYDVVIDGSDNVATRYLLNDACVLNKIPLVSGSALQTEAQLTVYNYQGGPCYRCLFPVPPPPETVNSCGDSGVIGPVPGIIGVLQSLQTIHILLNNNGGVLSGRLLLFIGCDTIFRNVKLRPRNVNCAVCGDNPTLTQLIDYEQFCGAAAHDKVVNIDIINENQQIEVKDLKSKLGSSLILDVRPALQYEICRLPNTTNIPLSDIERCHGLERIKEEIRQNPQNEVYVLCRRGNDSQRAIFHLRTNMTDVPVKFTNIKGGLLAYSKYVDNDFPTF